MGIEQLARPELLKRSAYVSALPSREHVRLHANESPWSIESASSASASTDDPTDREVSDRELNRYPNPNPLPLIEAMARYYGLMQEYVLPVRGSDDGIDLLIRAFCSAGQDSVTISSPTFSMYASFAGLQNAAIVDIPLALPPAGSGHFSLNTHGIIQHSPSSKLVFVCTPNNPTGHSVSTGDITQLCSALAGKSIVVVDEAYIEFSPFQSVTALLQEFENLVVLRTLSKAFGAAGIRCGAVLAQPALLAILRSIATPYSLSTLTINCALQGFESSALETIAGRVASLTEHCRDLFDALDSHENVERVYPSDSNFLLVKFTDANTAYAALKSAGVLVRNFSDKTGSENCLRISVGKEEENRMVLDVIDKLHQ